MRCFFWLAVVVLAGAGTAAGQNDAAPDELRKMYDDALVQLRLSQDRKNELATENEALQRRVAELEKQLTEARLEISGYAEKTFFLRSHYAAWQAFMQRHPGLLARWRLFLETDPLSVPHEPVEFYLFDREWPLAVEG